MSRRWIAIIIALFLVAGASFAVSSAICSRLRAARSEPAAGQGMSLVTGYLQLSPEQEERVGPINESFREVQHGNCIEMQEARMRLIAVIKNANAKQADLDAALADVERTQAKLQRRVAQYLMDLKSVLTPEQQVKLFDLVEQRFCEQGKCGGGICPGVGRRDCNGKPRCKR
jgi:Spy/CpxP family protein refolding chaperone